MNKALRKIIKPKKVELLDVASPKPSRAASRVLNDALEQAYRDQRSTSKQAAVIRGS